MGSLVHKHGEIIPQATRSTISGRYHTVTRAINLEFWNIQSETQNSMYVGSYGRGTAVDTSDLDILIELPKSSYDHFDSLKGNGQSRLLQVVKNSILAAYPRSDIRADGQVVKISFSDGMNFEILPAFNNTNNFEAWYGSYEYPDTNMGGNWLSTNPKAEQEAVRKKNDSSNGLFFDTCKHIRHVRDEVFNSYHLSGIVIDSFIYVAIGDWRWIHDGETSTSVPGDYERMLLKYFNQRIAIDSSFVLSAPGSCQKIEASKSLECLEKVLNYLVEY